VDKIDGLAYDEYCMIEGLKDLEDRAKDFGISRLSREVGLSRSFLYDIFKGSKTPTLDTFERLARALGYRVLVEPTPMSRPRRADILRKLRDSKRELQAAGIKTLALFGSVARDEATEESDVDLMVDIEGPKNLRNMGQADKAIATAIPYKVDVVYISSFKPEILANVQKDAIYVIGQKSGS
jgi:predicted nucleotidyltransferase